MVLDVCCGGRSFWFDKNDKRCIFLDKRKEVVKFDSPSHGDMDIKPNVLSDYTAIPFKSGSFDVVVFDPPHMRYHGCKCWEVKRYGRLETDWQFEIQAAFLECFRVLKKAGTLIFKWCDVDIPVSKVLALTREKPLFGHKSGRQSKTHWVCFYKG